MQFSVLCTLIWSKMWKIRTFFRLKKCSFLWVFPQLFINKKCASHFCRETANTNKHFLSRKNVRIFHIFDQIQVRSTENCQIYRKFTFPSVFETFLMKFHNECNCEEWYFIKKVEKTYARDEISSKSLENTRKS